MQEVPVKKGDGHDMIDKEVDLRDTGSREVVCQEAFF